MLEADTIELKTMTFLMVFVHVKNEIARTFLVETIILIIDLTDETIDFPPLVAP